jgi:hypothetical protein
VEEQVPLSLELLRYAKLKSLLTEPQKLKKALVQPEYP